MALNTLKAACKEECGAHRKSYRATHCHIVLMVWTLLEGRKTPCSACLADRKVYEREGMQTYNKR